MQHKASRATVATNVSCEANEEEENISDDDNHCDNHSLNHVRSGGRTCLPTKKKRGSKVAVCQALINRCASRSPLSPSSQPQTFTCHMIVWGSNEGGRVGAISFGFSS